MKKTIVYVVSIVMLSAAIQVHPIKCCAQAKVIKPATAQKLKGVLMGFYAGADGSYNIGFEKGVYSVRFNPTSGDGVDCSNVVADETKKTISFTKPNQSKPTKGTLTKKGLNISGKLYTDETSAD